jgi:hypothetical protein
VETYSIPLVFPGSGARSSLVRCRTAEAAPSVPPTDLSCTSAGLDHITITWDSPTVSAGKVCACVCVCVFVCVCVCVCVCVLHC